ncbi:hypothetical protein M8494_12565 [Serratia ureilytica]
MWFSNSLTPITPRDIDAFMACWADDAQYYEHPDTAAGQRQGGDPRTASGAFPGPSLYGERINAWRWGTWWSIRKW